MSGRASTSIFSSAIHNKSHPWVVSSSLSPKLAAVGTAGPLFQAAPAAGVLHPPGLQSVPFLGPHSCLHKVTCR